MKGILFLCMLTVFACSSKPEKTQEVFTDQSNYYDYEYYGEDLSELDTFESLYDYYYYDETDSYRDEYEPVELEEIPARAGDAWFFDDY